MYVNIILVYVNVIKMLISIVNNIGKSKVGDHSRGWPEGSLFDTYYTKV